MMEKSNAKRVAKAINCSGINEFDIMRRGHPYGCPFNMEHNETRAHAII